MAQPAVPVNEDRTDLLGIPPFGARTSVNPPFIWETWVGQFFLAVSLKDNISPGELLVAPAELVDEPYPKPEAPSAEENAADVADRNLRIAAANRRIDEYNQERRWKGPRIGHNWCYHEAEARLKYRLFFLLGNEGKKRFFDSYLHLDLNTSSFIDFHKCCEDVFKAERDYTVERIKLYSTIFMQVNDSFSSIYARLSAQTELFNWPFDQERATLKDLFIDRIRDVEVQRQLIRAEANLDDTLQLALENEKGAKTSEQFQKLLPRNNATSNTTNSIRVKQEPTSSVQQFKSQGNSSRGGGVNRPNQRQNQNKPCYFCGNPFSLEHRRSCPAREATCNACKKKGHFAKVCNTTRRRVNMVQNEEMATDQESNLIDVNGDSEPEYGVMAIDVVQLYNVELLKTAGGQPRSLSIQLRSGNSFFYSTVDTGSPVSFLNKKTADILMKRNPNVKFKDIARHPSDATYVDYNKKPIKLFGSLEISITSKGWKIEKACFLVSENCTRNLLGLNLHEKLGIETVQRRPAEVSNAEEDQELDSTS